MQDNNFLQYIEKESGEKVSACFQCQRCSNGCPVVYAMDYPPHRMIRMIQAGRQGDLLASRTIWVCATCETCSTRCPNDIEIATVMDTLRQLYHVKSATGKERKMPLFHQVFLDSVRGNGRVFELGMVGQYKLKTRDFFQDAKLGWEMFKKRKLKLIPRTIKNKHELRNIFQKAEKQRARQ